MQENIDGDITESYLGDFTWSGTPVAGTGESDWMNVDVPEDNAEHWVTLGAWTCTP